MTLRVLVLVLSLPTILVSALFGSEEKRRVDPPDLGTPGLAASAPSVIVQQGAVTWLQMFADQTRCPGDANGGHGGEATGGPDGSQTWCMEAGVGDTLGTIPPWSSRGFTYVDVRGQSSQQGINYWHVDSYRTDQRPYTGTRALWCGSQDIWQGQPVECGTWQAAPGYGNQWHCAVELSLPVSFDVADYCTLGFDPRYDMECKYDYFYLDVWNGTSWSTVATFNGTSSDPGPECGASSGFGNPDYFGNSDADRLVNCNWQDPSPTYPAFVMDVTASLDPIEVGPRFRWRFVSDGAVSDADGKIDTDGGAFIDNVMVVGSGGSRYFQDFETCSVNGPLPQYWSLVDPPGLAQIWHIRHDPDPPYEGGDGGTPTTCLFDSSWTFRARPESGYPFWSSWRSGWSYRLLSPRIGIENSGCIVQYDQYMCGEEITCDYTDTKVRIHDSNQGTWCPWINIDGYVLTGGCSFWAFDYEEEVSGLLGPSADSVQFGWDIMDLSPPPYPIGAPLPGDPILCHGRHAGTENIIDNISVGFYTAGATSFAARRIDLLQDSFLEEVSQGFNSFFNAYDPDTVARYSGLTPPPLPAYQQLCVDCRDLDGLSTVEIVGSVNRGQTWVTRGMTLGLPADPANLDAGGEYYGTLRAGDFSPGAYQWSTGTEVWYYVRANDELGNTEYFPATAYAGYPGHTGASDDYFNFSIMPTFPPSFTGPRILLVDDHERSANDWSPCATDLGDVLPLEDIYWEILSEAGYCIDKYDVNGAGGNVHIHPVDFSAYDAVVWFTGPYLGKYLIDPDAQGALLAYLAGGGKVVLCGDLIAYAMTPDAAGGGNEDALGGNFLAGVMGCGWVEDMESAFTKPFVYMEAEPTVAVFGTPMSLGLDTLCVYRECPYLKEMSYMMVNGYPPAGYTAQRLLRVLNPGIVPSAEGAIYVEYMAQGQCVFINFDLSGSVNRERGFCSGVTPDPAPDFNQGYYDGGVELMRIILRDIFGLPPQSGGCGGVTDVEPQSGCRWALAQNTPNPCVSTTEIRFDVARTSDVAIRVYNTMGQVVRVLKDGRLEPGHYSVAWDGTSTAGGKVASGVYFYEMKSGEFSATRKMLVVK